MDVNCKRQRMHLQLPWSDPDLHWDLRPVCLRRNEIKIMLKIQCASVRSVANLIISYWRQLILLHFLDAVILAAWQQKCLCVEVYLPKLKRVWSIRNILLFVQMEHWRWRAGQHCLIPPIIFSKVWNETKYVSVGRYWECNGVQLISWW